MKSFSLLFLVWMTSLAAQGEQVVCVHGFMGSSWNMYPIEAKLKKEGFEVTNWGYESREDEIKNHGVLLADTLRALARIHPEKPIHFVTHSMGALVLLAALNDEDCPEEAKKGRLVMIAPPLRGSGWGRWLHQFKIARKIAKKGAGKELMTKENFDDLGSFPSSLEKILIVTGKMGWNPLTEGKNDGTLAITESHLDVPHERVEINAGHKSILMMKKTRRLVAKFLRAQAR